jgi:RimJ/RimL family protein N-acetyltransferase
MFDIRMATVEDAATIAEHRFLMFLDSGQTTPEEISTLRERFVEWVKPKIEDGTYIGWLVVDGDAIVGGAGLWRMDFPPHWMDPEPVRAYLLNFYVTPSHRGHGLAPQMLHLAVDEAHRRGIRVVTLHASKFGKPIYEKNGFLPTNEMMLRES